MTSPRRLPWSEADAFADLVCKRNCKRTTRHKTVSGTTGRHSRLEIGELKHTVSYRTTRPVTRIFKLENRCTGNLTVGTKLDTGTALGESPPSSRNYNVARAFESG